MERKYIVLLGLLIFIAPFMVYMNSLHNEFLIGAADDEGIILRNHYLRSWRFLPRYFSENYQAGSGNKSNFWRPFQLIVYSLIVQTIGIKPLPFRIASILFHALCGIFLYAVFLKLFFKKISPVPIAFMVLLWLVHPIHNEELAVASGIASPFHMFWMLVALFSFIRFKEVRKIGWYVVSLAGFILSLFSKESAIIFPALLLGMHIFGIKTGMFGKEKIRDFIFSHIPFWGVASIYVLSRLTFLNFNDTLNFYNQSNIFTEHFSYRLYTLFTVLTHGLRIIFFPVGLHPEKSWPVFTRLFSGQVIISILILAVVVILAILSWRRRPQFSFGIFWFFLSYLPMSNLVAKINALVWEHWFYVPSAGIAISLISLMEKETIRRISLIIFIPVLILLSVLTIRRNKYWKNTESISRFILRYEPRSAKTWNNLAVALVDKGRFLEAVDCYLKAIAIDDIYPQTHHNLANLYRRLGRFDLAEKEYLKAIRLNGDFYHSYVGLGNLYLLAGDEDKAREYFKKALEIYPYLSEIRRFLEEDDDRQNRH